MSERAATSVWEGVAGLAKVFNGTTLSDACDREEFESSLIEDERNYMINYHIDKHDMWVGKGKNRRLNRRKYLPSKYRTAKSVAANCLEHGVKMHDSDGNVLAKSKCEASIKLAKQPIKGTTNISDVLETHSSFKEAQKLLDQLDKVWKDLNGGEREWVSDEVNVRYEYK